MELDITFTFIFCLVDELAYIMFLKMVMTAVLDLDYRINYRLIVFFTNSGI